MESVSTRVNALKLKREQIIIIIIIIIKEGGGAGERKCLSSALPLTPLFALVPVTRAETLARQAIVNRNLRENKHYCCCFWYSLPR